MVVRGKASRRIATTLLVAAMVVTVGACTRPAGQEDSAGADASGRSSVETVDESELGTAIEEGSFGSLTEVCGPAPDGEENTATGSVGVTADTITVGTISDPGTFARPGLNQELFDASTVFTEWCNDLGGINGRKLVLNLRDAALTRYRAAIEEACKSDFFLVGGGGVFDNTGQAERLNCMLPTLDAFSASPDGIGAALRVWPFGRNSGSQAGAMGRFLNDQFPDSTDAVGFLTAAVASINETSDGVRNSIESAGQTLVYDAQYNPIGESSWVPYAQKIMDEGVKGLYYLGEPHNLGLLIQALAQINYPLEWIAVTPNIYDPILIETAGDALDKIPVFAEVSAAPFESEGNVAMATYQALFEKYLPEGKGNTMLGVSSFSAWLMFAQAAKSCGADLTRRCVWDAANAVTTWDAGGLYPIAPPVDGRPVGCFVPVKATPAGFEVVEWNINFGLWNCSPDNLGGLVEEFGDVLEEGGSEFTLESAGKTIDDLK